MDGLLKIFGGNVVGSTLFLTSLAVYPTDSHAFTYGQEINECGTIVESVEEVPGFFSYLIEPEFLRQRRYHLETFKSLDTFLAGERVCFNGVYLGKCYEDYLFSDTFFCSEETKYFYCGTMVLSNSESGSTIIPESLENLFEGKDNSFFPKPSKEVIDVHPLYYLIKQNP